MRDALRVRHGSVGRIGARRHAHRGESRRARGKGEPAGCEHHGHLFDVLEGSARWMSEPTSVPPSLQTKGPTRGKTRVHADAELLRLLALVVFRIECVRGHADC